MVIAQILAQRETQEKLSACDAIAQVCSRPAWREGNGMRYYVPIRPCLHEILRHHSCIFPFAQESIAALWGPLTEMSGLLEGLCNAFERMYC
jgi:hypothetical protein